RPALDRHGQRERDHRLACIPIGVQQRWLALIEQARYELARRRRGPTGQRDQRLALPGRPCETPRSLLEISAPRHVRRNSLELLPERFSSLGTWKRERRPRQMTTELCDGQLAAHAFAAVADGRETESHAVRPDDREIEPRAHQRGPGAFAIDGIGYCLGVVIKRLPPELRFREAIREGRAGLAVQIVEILDRQSHNAGLTAPIEITESSREP